MCVDPISAALTIGSGVAQYAGQRASNNAQIEMYNNKARVDEANAELERRRQQQVAENYGHEDVKLRSQMREARSRAIAEAGGSGFEGSGSVADNLSGINDLFNLNAINSLYNQRNDVGSLKMNEYNFMENAKANRSAAANIKSSNKGNLLGTILGTAGSLYGLSKDFSKAGAAKGEPVAYDVFTKKPIYKGDKRLV